MPKPQSTPRRFDLRMSIAYDFLPKRHTLQTCQVMDLFGIGFDVGKHVIADEVKLSLQAGDAVLFTGPSGSGKSSLLRAVVAELAARGARPLWLESLTWPERPLVDILPLSLKEGLELLTACGLGEPQLLLRTPAELSEGQRYRFRLALGLARLRHVRPAAARWLVADEFTATLDRTLAQVVAFNLGRVARRRHVGLLLATTHEDVTADLRPHLHVSCDLDGRTQLEENRTTAGGKISFFRRCWLSGGTRADWAYFARWHYRSHHLSHVRRVVLLWDDQRPIGICVFAAPVTALRARHEYFGLRPVRDPLYLKQLNRQLWVLSRVVLHPSYRGAELAAPFVRAACRTCPVPWIETLTALGHLVPFFERAGFQRVGIVRKPLGEKRRDFAGLYGTRRLTAATARKSRHAEPIYYVFDNRPAASQTEGQRRS